MERKAGSARTETFSLDTDWWIKQAPNWQWSSGSTWRWRKWRSTTWISNCETLQGRCRALHPFSGAPRGAKKNEDPINKDRILLGVLITAVIPPSWHDNVSHAPVLGSNCTKRSWYKTWPRAMVYIWTIPHTLFQQNQEVQLIFSYTMLLTFYSRCHETWQWQAQPWDTLPVQQKGLGISCSRTTSLLLLFYLAKR